LSNVYLWQGNVMQCILVSRETGAMSSSVYLYREKLVERTWRNVYLCRENLLQCLFVAREQMSICVERFCVEDLKGGNFDYTSLTLTHCCGLIYSFSHVMYCLFRGIVVLQMCVIRLFVMGLWPVQYVQRIYWKLTENPVF